MHVFGPVLQYDLVTTARKSRYFAMRFFYAALLFLVLYIFYAVKLEGSDVGRVARQKLIDFAEFFSYTYLIIQYILVLLLTPAYVGTAIAEEKERRTLEFLMATDLKSHEIILGKTASRLGNLLMFLLAGLPVLMFVLFFGGIDPELLKNGFIATLLTAISITCVSIYCSTHAPRSRDGILRSYLVVVGYFIMCIILGWLVIFLQGQFWTVGISWKLENADLITQGLCYFTEYFLTGNIFHAIYLYISTTYTPFLGFTSWTGVNLGTSIDQILRNYSIFHLILAVLCLTISIRRLRRLFALHTFGEKASKPFTRFKHQPDSNVNKNIRDKGKKTELSVRRRYRIDSWPPMVWKEVLLPRWNMSGVWLRVVKLFAWAGFLLPLGMLFLFNFQHGRFDWYELQQTTNVYARIAGTICLCLMILAVGIRASSSICIERDKQTLETLLSTTLTDHEILIGKWIGCVFGFGSTALLITIIWTTCLITGGLSALSVLLLLLAYFAYAGFAAALGLYFSAGARTTTRSLMGTIFWLLLWMGGHWAFVGGLLLLLGINQNHEILHVFVALTPPLVLGISANPISNPSFGDDLPGTEYKQHYIYMLGLVIYLLVAVVFYFLAVHRFYLRTGRIHSLKR